MRHGEFSGSEVPLVPGALRVYREWRAADVAGLSGYLACDACAPLSSPGIHLIPINFPTPWVDGENVAVCQRDKHRHAPHIYVGPEHVGPETEVPGRQCQCGFYGTYKPIGSRRSPEFVTGVVEVYGRVIIGTRGVRAQKARIVAASYMSVYGPKGDYPDRLMERYPSVDWMLSPDDLHEKYPPQNVDEILGVDTEAAAIEADWEGRFRVFLLGTNEMEEIIKNLEETFGRNEE